MLHVVTFETERSSVLANPTQSDVNVRVIGIEVRYGNPFEASIEIPYHALRQVAGQPDQVHLVSKLRRQDELPQACIAGGLPLVETSGDLETSLGRIKSGFSGAPLAGTLPSDVAPMCLPLSACGILRVHPPYRASLIVRARWNAALGSGLVPTGTQEPGIAEKKQIGGAPGSGRTGLPTARSPGIEPELLRLFISHDLAPGGRHRLCESCVRHNPVDDALHLFWRGHVCGRQPQLLLLWLRGKERRPHMLSQFCFRRPNSGDRTGRSRWSSVAVQS